MHQLPPTTVANSQDVLIVEQRIERFSFRAIVSLFVMASSSDAAADKKPVDYVRRGNYQTNYTGALTFVGFRAADPFLQYGILAQGLGASLIQAFGGQVRPMGSALVTNTALDGFTLGMSPSRVLLLTMSIGSMLKQNYYQLAIMQEEMPFHQGVMVGMLNATLNTLNSIFFIWNGASKILGNQPQEDAAQPQMVIGFSMFVIGLTIEWMAEVQRTSWKKRPENRGKVYSEGLFSLSRHINYFGYTLWRGGYALAGGGWLWGAFVGGWFAWDFRTRAIPVLQDYLRRKVSSDTLPICCA